ncbi:NACHT domain-containing protein [Marinifilum flexuosum]|uniref:NACHT domain-containing protein n=1 Tax=Marinifilum flexuosum TaxID=1117708 RepID=UPI002494740B|nr:NACHT domain-containing protein [Marinifilum flexuosum]
MHRIRFFNQVEVETNKDEITKLLKNALVNHSEFCVRYTVAKLRVRANIVLENYLSLKNGDYFKKLKSYQSRLLDKKEIDLIACLERCISLILDYSTVVQASNEILNDLLKQYDKFNLQFENFKKSLPCEICSELKIIKCEIEQCIHEKPTMDALIYISSGNITNIELPIDHSKKIKTISKKGEELKHFEDGEFKALENFINKQTNYNYETVNLTIGFFNIGLAENIPFPEPKQLAPLSPEQNLTEKLKQTYTTDKDFTQIKTIGITSENFPTLCMDDFYMDLSFLNKNDLISRDAYIKKEQESFREKVTRNNYPHNVISKTILINTNRTVIIGNPGTGKSTFARWLCNNWANNNLDDYLTPIYIDLKQIYLNNFDLVEYIHNVYKIEIADAESILTAKNLKYRLILDGLDEISNKEKNKLHHAIHSLNIELEQSYILLCRPYALTQNDFEDIKPCIEIIGYNTSSRNHYIDKVFNKHPDRIESKKRLYQLINTNSVLGDLSYNPLLLFFITSSFFNQENDTELNKVETTYDMYDWALEKIINHSCRKNNIELREWHKNEEQIQEFAYEMIINRTFVYIGGIRDMNRSTAETLALFELGKFESYGESNWQFHFHSITTQEYLAAEFISNKISSKSINYLQKDSFYWNYIIMIIGCLNKQKENERIHDILNAMIEELDNDVLIKHQFFMILSECNADVISSYTNNKIITDLITIFLKSYTSLLNGAARKLISKFKPSANDILIQIIISNTSEILSRYLVDPNFYISNQVDRLLQLCSFLNDLPKQKLISKITAVLENHIDQLSMNLNPKLDFKEIFLETKKCVDILPKKKQCELLRKLNQIIDTKLTFLDYDEKEEVQLSLNFFERSVELSSRIKDLKNQITQPTFQSLSKDQKENILNKFSVYCYYLGVCHQNSSESEKSKITQELLSHLDFAEAINQSINNELKGLQFDSIDNIYSGYLELRTDDTEADIFFLKKFNYIDLRYFDEKKTLSLLKKYHDEIHDQPYLFEYIFYKSWIENQFEFQYLDSYINLLADKTFEKNSLIYNHLVEITDKDPTNWIVLSKILQSNLINDANFKTNYLLRIIRFSEFHDQKVWDLLKESLLDYQAQHVVTKILSRPEIFTYPDNMDYIISTWEVFFDHYKSSKCVKESNNKNAAIQILLSHLKTKQFQKNPHQLYVKIRNFLNSIIANNSLSTCINTCILDYLIENKFNASNFATNYNDLDDEEKVKFIGLFINLFSTSEIELVEGWPSRQLQSEILQKSKIQKNNTQTFNRAVFESYLLPRVNQLY